MIKLYGYSKCSTVRKAKNWLDENNIAYEDIDMVKIPPSREEMENIYKTSGLEIKKFFNTSGMRYRELGLKDKLQDASEDEMYELLASDGMLIKRPIVTNGTSVTLGFNEEQFESVWKKYQ